MKATSKHSPIPALANAALTDISGRLQKVGQDLNLSEFIKEAGLDMLERLLSVCNQMPTVAAAIDEFHGLDTISAAIKTAGQRVRAAQSTSVLNEPRPTKPAIKTGSVLEPPALLQHPIKTGELKIITYDFTESTKLPEGATEEDAEKLKNDLVLIKDKRDPQKQTIPVQLQTDKTFFNPDSTGLYEILTRAGEFEKCLVITNPQGPGRRRQFSVVVRVTDPRNWRNIATRSLWAVHKYSEQEYTEWFDGLADGKSLSKGKRCYVLVSPLGDGSVPFRVKQDLGTQTGEDVYEISFDTYCPGPYDFPMNGSNYGEPKNIGGNGYNSWADGNDCCEQRLHIDGKGGTSFRNYHGDVYVPTSFKVLPVSPEETDEDDEYGMSNGQSKTSPILPGNISDVELNLLGKTAEFSIYNNGTDIQINGGKQLSQLDGLITLVRDHGFAEDVARGIIKRSARLKKFACRVIYPEYIKQAADPYLAGQGPSAPSFPPTPYAGESFMGNNVQTQSPMEQDVPIPGMQPPAGNRAIYDPTQNMTAHEKNTLQSAVDMGQKEIPPASVEAWAHLDRAPISIA